MNGWGGEWLPKAFVYGGLFVGVGVAVARQLRAFDVRADHALFSRLVQFGTTSAMLVLFALLARVLFHTAGAFGWPDAFSWENLRVVAMESRWGNSWQIQFCAAAIVAISAWAARRWSIGWIAYTVAIAALSLSIPLVGHAAGSWTRYLLHAVHIVAGAAWLGSLTVLVSLRRSQPGKTVAPMIQRFSPLALTASTVVAISGTIAAFLYVVSIQNLITTTYGQVLLLKIVCVALVAACGALNWRRVRAGELPSSRTMFVEVLAALAVVIVTSVLTETEHP